MCSGGLHLAFEYMCSRRPLIHNFGEDYTSCGIILRNDIYMRLYKTDRFVNHDAVSFCLCFSLELLILKET